MYYLSKEEQEDINALKKVEQSVYKQYEKLMELDLNNKKEEKEEVTRNIMYTLIEEIPYASKYLEPEKANRIYNYLLEKEKIVEIDNVDYYCNDNIDSLINKRIINFFKPFALSSKEMKNKMLKGYNLPKEVGEYCYSATVNITIDVKKDINKILINNIEEAINEYPDYLKKELIRTKYNIIFINNTIENTYLEEGYDYIDFPYIEGKLDAEMKYQQGGLLYENFLNDETSHQLLYSLIELNNSYNDLDLDNPKKLKEIIIHLITIKTALSGTYIQTIKENIDLVQILISSQNKNISKLILMTLKDYEQTKNKHKVISLNRNTK